MPFLKDSRAILEKIFPQLRAQLATFRHFGRQTFTIVNVELLRANISIRRPRMIVSPRLKKRNGDRIERETESREMENA